MAWLSHGFYERLIKICSIHVLLLDVHCLSGNELKCLGMHGTETHAHKPAVDTRCFPVKDSRRI